MLNWNDIQGHEKTQDVLVRAIESDRVHHAYLFVGPDGVGKRATAMALAAALNCKERPHGTFQQSCGTCTSCRKMWQNQHPDLHVIEPDGRNIKIAQIRTISKAAVTRPYEGRYQIVIIDEAHKMTDEAANALLKTLEEPPDSMRIMLVTDQPHLLLDTILSRCQMVRFSPLPPSTVATLIDNSLTDDEKSGFDPALFEIAAGYGAGSVGRALEILRSGALEERAALLRRLVDLDPNRQASMLDWASELAKDREMHSERLESLRMLFRDMMMTKVAPAGDRVINRDLAPDMLRLAERLSVGDVLARLDAISECETLLARNVNPQLAMEHLLLALAAPASGRPETHGR